MRVLGHVCTRHDSSGGGECPSCRSERLMLDAAYCWRAGLCQCCLTSVALNGVHFCQPRKEPE